LSLEYLLYQFLVRPTIAQNPTNVLTVSKSSNKRKRAMRRQLRDHPFAFWMIDMFCHGLALQAV
jgi:hypothetical protein